METRNQQGFTLMELAIIMAIMSILSAMAMIYFNDSLKTSRDAAVYANAQNLITTINNQILDRVSVDYQSTTVSGSTVSIGATEEDGSTARAPIPLSPGVQIVFTAGFDNKCFKNMNLSSFAAYIYHANGSRSPFDPTGNNRRGVQIIIDETTRVNEYIMF